MKSGVLHEKGRQMFVDFLRTQSSVPRPWQWGAGLDQPSLSRLHDLLRQHGVPDNQLATRTHLITQMIGVQDLQGSIARIHGMESPQEFGQQVPSTFAVGVG